MCAYFFFNFVKINDLEGMVKYRHHVFETVQKYGGEFIVIGGPLHVKEGNPQYHTPVIIRFQTKEKAEAWYYSQEYAPLLKLRRSCGEFEVFVLEGIA